MFSRPPSPKVIKVPIFLKAPPQVHIVKVKKSHSHYDDHILEKASSKLVPEVQNFSTRHDVFKPTHSIRIALWVFALFASSNMGEIMRSFYIFNISLQTSRKLKNIPKIHFRENINFKSFYIFLITSTQTLCFLVAFYFPKKCFKNFS